MFNNTATDKCFTCFLDGMFIELFTPLDQERSIDNNEDIQATWHEYLDSLEDVNQVAYYLTNEQLEKIKAKWQEV